MIVYKYFKIDKYFFENIGNNELWYSKAKDFNDPYDCNLPFKQLASEITVSEFMSDLIEYSVKYIPNFKYSLSDIPKFMAAYRTHPEQTGVIIGLMLKKAIETFSICCFTKSNCSLPMWAFYGDGNKGLCLGFDNETFKFLDNTSGFFDVDYPEENNYPILFQPGKKARDFIISMLLTKSIFWKQEEEIRCLSIAENGNIKFTKESLREVVFGYKTPGHDINSIKRFFDQQGYKVNYFTCTPSETKLELNILELK